MEMTNTIGQLFGLSFSVFWVLLVTLIFIAWRQAMNAEPIDDDQSNAQSVSVGSLTQYMLDDDKGRRVAALAVEAKAKSYFARRIGIVHLSAMAFFAATTLILAIWNLHEVKMRRIHPMPATLSSQQIKQVSGVLSPSSGSA